MIPNKLIEIRQVRQVKLWMPLVTDSKLLKNKHKNVLIFLLKRYAKNLTLFI